MKDATKATIKNLRKGLALARAKLVQVREKALAGLSAREAQFLTLGIRILVDRTKGKEIQKYDTVQQRLEVLSRDCNKHSICNWMRRRMKSDNYDKTSDRVNKDIDKSSD